MKSSTRPFLTPRLGRITVPVVVAVASCFTSAAAPAENRPEAPATGGVPAGPGVPPLTVVAEQPDVTTVVQRELARQLPRSGDKIRVEGEGGEIVLRGEVEIYPDRERAREIAEGVRGVRQVDVELSVRPRAKIPDEQIVRSVQSSFASDGGVSDLNIDVGVQNGVVTLHGKVETDPQRRVAGWLASRIRGVTGLNNRLTVVPERRDDADIRRQLARHYANSPVFDDDTLEVEVRDGVVRLSGAVDNVLEQNWARGDAWVPGVRQVDATQLELSYDPAPLRSATRGAGISDSDIREAIHQLYVFDPRIDSFKPEIAVDNRVVTLSGYISTPKAKQAAVQIARHTGGVTDVIDRLEVRPAEPRADETIAASLRSALRNNAVVEAAAIDVDVSDGRAVLTGETDTTFEKWTAGDLAERIAGVTAVENRITVANDASIAETADYYYPTAQALQPWFPSPPSDALGRTDEELAQALRSELAINPITDALLIDVKVQRGVVTLHGEVGSSLERRAAAGLALHAGARDVVNQLRIAATE